MRSLMLLTRVCSQDAVTMAYAEANYLQSGGELDMKSYRISNVADTINPQEVKMLQL